MKSRALFISMILALIFTIVLGPGMATQSIQAAASLFPASLPNLPVGDRVWNLLYIDGLNNSLNIGAEPSLAFDKVANLPYISYYKNSTQELILGRWVDTGGN